MDRFNIRELNATDTEALLAFEVDNRQWFESHIDARPQAFYSPQGVAEHIDAYLSGLASGTWHPFVIEDAEGHIVGRANLKDIDLSAGLAEVGYRVGQRVCGKGLATRALEHLIEQARECWQLKELVAHVYKDNTGSRIVLERCGFARQPASGGDAASREDCFVLAL